MTKYQCPVCGYIGLHEAPYNSEGLGSFEICPCCGFEFGCDDFPDKAVAIDRWRSDWIAQKFPWFSQCCLPPEEWDPQAQLMLFLGQGK